jgi:hypothetical protein
MFGNVMSVFRNIVKMSVEERKERLVQIRVKQLMRERVTGNEDDNISPMEEIEAIAILQSLFPVSSEETTIDGIVQLREEINKRAEAIFTKKPEN